LINRINKIYKKSVFSSIFYQLKDLIILNFEAIIYVFNNLSYFSNFRKALRGDYLIAEDSHVFILEYGDITL